MKKGIWVILAVIYEFVSLPKLDKSVNYLY